MTVLGSVAVGRPSARDCWNAAWTEGRRANAARYRALFAEAGLSGTVALPAERPDRYHIYNQFVIRVSDRDGLKRHLDAAGVGTEIYYPVPFHRQECFAFLGYTARFHSAGGSAAYRLREDIDIGRFSYGSGFFDLFKTGFTR